MLNQINSIVSLIGEMLANVSVDVVSVHICVVEQITTSLAFLL